MDQRVLSAVMFTDIVGYSALANKDEDAALKLLGINNSHQKTIIEKHGTYLKEIGDGVLARFTSAYDSVQCAIEIQETAPEELKKKIRIGIHLGDISERGDDIFGDGVNIASRLESKATPGAIYISDSVQQAIKGRGDIQTAFVGDLKLKNIEGPVRTYRINLKASHQFNFTTAALRKTIGYLFSMVLFGSVIIELMEFLVARNNLDEGLVDMVILVLVFIVSGILLFNLLKTFQRRQVIFQLINVLVALFVLGFYVVNPLSFNPSALRIFDFNYSGTVEIDPNMLVILPISSFIGDDQTYIAEAIHSGLITEVGKLDVIPVIGETTARSYKDSGKSLGQIAKELHAKVVMEASLHQLDSTFELNVRLIEPLPEERLLWSNTYRRQLNELPKLYKDITINIADNIEEIIAPVDRIRLNNPEIVNAAALENMLLASHFMGFLTPEGFDRAEEYLQKSIEQDSAYSPALGLMSLLWGSKKQMGLVSPNTANPIMKKYLTKALQADSSSSEGWGSLGAYLVWTNYDPVNGAKAFEKSIQLNPNIGPSRAAYAHTLMILNRWDEAWEQMQVAMEIDPLNPWVIAFAGTLYANEGKFLSASKKFAAIASMVPDHPMANMYLLTKYSRTFQYKKAILELKKFIGPENRNELESQIDASFAADGFKAAVQTTAEGLAEIRNTRFFPASFIYVLYGLIGDNESTIKWIEQAYLDNDPNLPYLAIRNDDPIQEDARYIAIMKKMGLW